MKRLLFICLFLCLITPFLLPQSNPLLSNNRMVNRASSVAPIPASLADANGQAMMLDSGGLKQVLSKAVDTDSPDTRSHCWTTTELHSSASPSLITDGVTFTAEVNMATYCRDEQTFCGEQSVVFYDRGTEMGSAYVNTSCVATIGVIFQTAGTHHITATLIPTSGWSQSSGHFAQVVEKSPTTTTLSSSQNPSSYREEVTFTATVTATTGLVPTGRVKFTNGATTLGFATLDDNGVATFTKKFLPVGTNAIQGEYLSNSFYATSSSGVLNQVVNPLP